MHDYSRSGIVQYAVLIDRVERTDYLYPRATRFGDVIARDHVVLRLHVDTTGTDVCTGAFDCVFRHERLTGAGRRSNPDAVRVAGQDSVVPDVGIEGHDYTPQI